MKKTIVATVLFALVFLTSVICARAWKPMCNGGLYTPATMVACFELGSFLFVDYDC